MGDKLSLAILICLLVIFGQTSCQDVDDDKDIDNMIKEIVLRYFEHIAYSSAFTHLIEGDHFPQNQLPSQDESLTVEFSTAFNLIELEVCYIHEHIENFTFQQILRSDERVEKIYLDMTGLFEEPECQDPLHYVSDPNLEVLYFECMQTIADSGWKLYYHWKTRSDVDKNKFLMTAGKLENCLLVMFQGLLGEHGSDSDILQAAKAYSQKIREKFISTMRYLLGSLDVGSMVLAHAYSLNDSLSISDWSKIQYRLLKKEVQVRKIQFVTSLEWANQPHVKEELIEFVKEQKETRNTILARILCNYLTSNYPTDNWIVIVYDALDEIDLPGLVGHYHHVFQVNGKNIIATHQSKYLELFTFPKDTTLVTQVINYYCSLLECDLRNVLKLVDILQIVDSLDQYSLIAINTKANPAHYFHDKVIGCDSIKLGGENLFMLYVVQSFGSERTVNNPSKTIRSRTEL